MLLKMKDCYANLGKYCKHNALLPFSENTLTLELECAECGQIFKFTKRVAYVPET